MFLSILDLHLSIAKSVFDYHKSGVNIIKLKFDNDENNKVRRYTSGHYSRRQPKHTFTSYLAVKSMHI